MNKAVLITSIVHPLNVEASDAQCHAQNATIDLIVSLATIEMNALIVRKNKTETITSIDSIDSIKPIESNPLNSQNTLVQPLRIAFHRP